MAIFKKTNARSIETITIDYDNMKADYVKNVVGGDVFTDTLFFKSLKSIVQYPLVLLSSGYIRLV